MLFFYAVSFQSRNTCPKTFKQGLILLISAGTRPVILPPWESFSNVWASWKVKCRWLESWCVFHLPFELRSWWLRWWFRLSGQLRSRVLDWIRNRRPTGILGWQSEVSTALITPVSLHQSFLLICNFQGHKMAMLCLNLSLQDYASATL